MSNTVTMTKARMTALVAQAVALALQGKGKSASTVSTANLDGKSERSIKNEIAVVKAFKKAGFGNVTPHVDVMTFNRWVAAGFRPLEGSKSLKVKNLRLFHKTQVRTITTEEKAALKEQNEAAIARYEGKSNVTEITQVQ